jgi:hypothetical protein
MSAKAADGPKPGCDQLELLVLEMPGTENRDVGAQRAAQVQHFGCAGMLAMESMLSRSLKG